MKKLSCRCGGRLFFDNTRCLRCQRELGFEPTELIMLAFREGELPRRYRRCSNADVLGCNWLVPSDSATGTCEACSLNRDAQIPQGETGAEVEQRREVERAKRLLIYGLKALGLPVEPKLKQPKWGLQFSFERATPERPVLTGHDDGNITLNLAEADPAHREKTRVALHERYRTLLGHFRHEVGHYYWYLLIQDRAPIARFRELFGDERRDYAKALKEHYAAPEGGAPQDSFISHYAASHPWEDFAETFAHYLHMVDTLETATAEGFSQALSTGPKAEHKLDRLLSEWYELSVSLNQLNRSMGLQDAYPFAIAPQVAKKLGFVHQLVHEARRAMVSPWYAPWRKPRLDQRAAPDVSSGSATLPRASTTG